MTANVLYALLWLSFGLAHSILTTRSVKLALDPWLGYRYRLIYNLVATLHIALVVIVGYYLYHDAGTFQIEAWQRLVQTLLSVGGVLITLMALRQYDMSLFAGFTQWKKGKTGRTDLPVEALNTDGLNSFIRHPLYTGMFMILWGNATSQFGLMTALWGSLYLVIGQGFEEKKLVDDYGEAYRQYQKTVPAFIPWKGRPLKMTTGKKNTGKKNPEKNNSGLNGSG